MATKKQVLEVLAGESGPITPAALSGRLGERVSSFTTQVNRWINQGVIARNQLGELYLTNDGRQAALEEGVDPDLIAHMPELGKGGLPEPPPPTEESLGTTEFQHFVRLGKVTGVVPITLIEQVADHIWRGGDWHDLTWVWKGLTEMGVRSDLAQRWWHSWRSFLRQPIPQEIATEVAVSSKSETARAAEAAKKHRTHIIDGQNIPVYVGPGLGDLDYEDAIRLAEARAVGFARTGQLAQQQSLGSMGEEFVKVINAVREAAGPTSQPKSYVVKPGEEGYSVEEVEPGKPLVLGSPISHGNAPTLSYYVDPEGNVQEIPLGRPIVIQQPAPAPQQAPTKHYLVDKTTGEVQEVSQGSPVIIIQQDRPPASQSTPIELRDREGNPIVMDLSNFIKLEEHRNEERRKDETHESKIEITKAFKDMLNKAGRALGRMGEE